MRVLLVQGRSPRTYWSFDKSLPFIGKAATMPPLGLATLAAHLPERWSLRLRDLNVAPLDDADLRWADAVLVSGMLVQAPSMREVLLPRLDRTLAALDRPPAGIPLLGGAAVPAPGAAL